MAALFLFAGAVQVTGCAQRHAKAEQERREPPESPQVVVVAPVLNLSNSTDWDPLQVTDTLASEFQSFDEFVVVPVNRTLAALRELGLENVATPDDALQLAALLGGDLVAVLAITEYEPYSPPRVGMVLQCYRSGRWGGSGDFDPVAASRAWSQIAPAGAVQPDRAAPFLQVQEVYDAARADVLDALEEYGLRRGGYQSPYSWRVHAQSQELFVRFSCWATIRSMKEALAYYRSRAAPAGERP
jgi:hypothetical protein